MVVLELLGALAVVGAFCQKDVSFPWGGAIKGADWEALVMPVWACCDFEGVFAGFLLVDGLVALWGRFFRL